MEKVGMTTMDEITMRLVHYFITKENYQPVIVNGVENEVWLENTDKHYEVIRISSNYIHNNDQLTYDTFKTKSVVKQIKKKMLSFNCNTLSILLNVGENVETKTDDKHYDVCQINQVNEVTESGAITDLFPEIKNDILDEKDEMEFFLKITSDINKTTNEKNRLYEKTFSPKNTYITYILIAINLIIYLLQSVNILDYGNFGMNKYLFKSGEYYRVITAAFFHGGILHLACNMYSLMIIGKELETVLGKVKYLAVYIISAICASLLSACLGGNIMSIGASGAIFGLMGALLYFGYHYRLYIGNVITSQLVPIIMLNLFIGFTMTGIDNYAHIGGLVGGLFAGWTVGIEGKTNKTDTINGIIVTVILIAFLLYMVLFR